MNKKESPVSPHEDPLFVKLEFNLTDVIWEQQVFRELVRLWDDHYVIVSLWKDITENVRLRLRKADPEPMEVTGLAMPDFAHCRSMEIHWRPPQMYDGYYYECLMQAMSSNGYYLTARPDYDSEKREAFYRFRLYIPRENVFGFSETSLSQDTHTLTLNRACPSDAEGRLYYLTQRGYSIISVQTPSAQTDDKTVFTLRRVQKEGGL